MNQPKGLLNKDVDVSAASVLYLVWLLTRACRGQYHSVIYNYYDGYQELTQELAKLGCTEVGEFMDDEVSMVTATGYLLVRNRYWFTLDQIAALDKLYPLTQFPEVVP